MHVPPAIVYETNWQAVGWAFEATDYPSIDVFSRISGCRLVARRTTCGWKFTVRQLYKPHAVLAQARGSVSVGPWGYVRWSYDTGARRRGVT